MGPRLASSFGVVAAVGWVLFPLIFPPYLTPSFGSGLGSAHGEHSCTDSGLSVSLDGSALLLFRAGVVGTGSSATGDMGGMPKRADAASYMTRGNGLRTTVAASDTVEGFGEDMDAFDGWTDGRPKLHRSSPRAKRPYSSA